MSEFTEHFISDEAIWTQVQRGNQLAFETLYHRFFRILYNYGRKISPNQAVVEDSIHDVFFDLWNYRENLSSTTSVRFYLYRALRRRIVRNEQKDHKTSVFEFQLDEIFIQKALPHEDDIVQKEQKDEWVSRLTRQLNNLSPRQYEALVLRFYDDFSYEEIAEIMSVNEQSARNLVQRGLEQLRHFSRILSAVAPFFVLLLQE